MNKSSSRPARNARVTVTAPARLHMGFMDLNGSLGRSFGSLGLTISGLATVVDAEVAETFSADGAEAVRALAIARRLASLRGLPGGARISVRQAIPAHAGLGSGTQLALAVGTALARLNDVDLSPRSIAEAADRGARSGIGIGAFETGGFIVDGGRGNTDAPPHVIARAAFPEAWRVLLIFDSRQQGMHGSSEAAAFRTLPTFPGESAAQLCRLVMMQLLPALAEQDIARFGQAVSTLQQVVGDHFAPAQGGRFASPAVAEVLAWLASEGVAGVGQSSWGPTGFAILASEVEAQDVLRRVRTRWPAPETLSFMVCQGLNSGARITELALADTPDRRRLAAHSF